MKTTETKTCTNAPRNANYDRIPCKRPAAPGKAGHCKQCYKALCDAQWNYTESQSEYTGRNN